jgi:hypothetical protein
MKLDGKPLCKHVSALTPQIIIVAIDDGPVMRSKNGEIVTEILQDFVISLQAHDMDTPAVRRDERKGRGIRYITSVAKIAQDVTSIVEVAAPADIELRALLLRGWSSRLHWEQALSWSSRVLKSSLHHCRGIQGYREKDAPNPLCVCVLGSNDDSEGIANRTGSLSSIPFVGGQVDIVICSVDNSRLTLRVESDSQVLIGAEKLFSYIASPELSSGPAPRPPIQEEQQGGS